MKNPLPYFKCKKWQAYIEISSFFVQVQNHTDCNSTNPRIFFSCIFLMASHHNKITILLFFYFFLIRNHWINSVKTSSLTQETTDVEQTSFFYLQKNPFSYTAGEKQRIFHALLLKSFYDTVCLSIKSTCKYSGQNNISSKI